MWREVLYRAVQSSTGLYPSNLGNLINTNLNTLEEYNQEHWVVKANTLLKDLPSEWRSLIGEEFKFNSEMMADMIEWVEEGQIYAGSDGSVENGRGAHSFVISSSIKKSTIWGGSATTPGSIEEMASQRSEHAGSIAVLLVLHIFQQCIQRNFNALVWIDNAEVIRRGNMGEITGPWKDTLVLDYDLWAVTNKVISLIEFTFTWEKVDSHIEEKKRKNPKKRLCGNERAWRLNEAADELAGKQRKRDIGVQEVFFSEAGVMVKLENRYLYGDLHSQITEAIHGPPLKEYMCTKFGWEVSTFNNINWRAMGSYTKGISSSKATNLLKLAMN